MIYQSDEQMVKDEINCDDGNDRLASTQHSFIHNFYPGFLS